MPVEVTLSFTPSELLTDKLGNPLTISKLRVPYYPSDFRYIPEVEPTENDSDTQEEEEDDDDEIDIVDWFEDVMRFMVFVTVIIIFCFSVLVGRSVGIWVFINFV